MCLDHRFWIGQLATPDPPLCKPVLTVVYTVIGCNSASCHMKQNQSYPLHMHCLRLCPSPATLRDTSLISNLEPLYKNLDTLLLHGTAAVVCSLCLWCVPYVCGVFLMPVVALRLTNNSIHRDCCTQMGRGCVMRMPMSSAFHTHCMVWYTMTDNQWLHCSFFQTGVTSIRWWKWFMETGQRIIVSVRYIAVHTTTVIINNNNNR